MPKKDWHRADGELFSLDIPSYRTFPISRLYTGLSLESLAKV